MLNPSPIWTTLAGLLPGLRRCSPLWWCATLLAIAFIFTIMSYSNLESYSNPNQPAEIGNPASKCEPSAAVASLYVMKTALGVNYDAGHWFHVAENFMAQHSMLRKAGRQTTKAHIFYCFDKASFWEDLNGFTELLILLGTLSDSANPDITAHFLDCTGDTLKAWEKLSIGDATILSSHLTYGGIKDVLRGPGSNRFTHAPTMRLGLASAASSAQQEQSQDALSTLRGGLPSIATGTSLVAATIDKQSIGSSAYAGSSSPLATPICVEYMGSVGGYWPAIDRGHWFPNAGDIHAFRTKISTLCPFNMTNSIYSKKQQYKIVIYQRDLNRKIANLDEALGHLHSVFDSAKWDIEVLMHDSDRSPCVLAAILHNADVLVTPHGFQSMLLMFMPRTSVLFEVFPYKYFKTGYARFGTEYGITYNSVMSPPTNWHTRLLLSMIDTTTCMSYKQCRGYARSADVIFTRNAAISLKETTDSYLQTIAKQKPELLFH